MTIRRVNIPRTGSDDLAALIPGEITISVGAEAANSIDVTIQLYDMAGNKPTEAQMVGVWLSDTAGKTAVTGTTPDGTTGPSTGTMIAAIAAKIHERVLSNATGLIVFAVGHAGAAHNWYLNVDWAGVVRASAVIAL